MDESHDKWLCTCLPNVQTVQKWNCVTSRIRTSSPHTHTQPCTVRYSSICFICSRFCSLSRLIHASSSSSPSWNLRFLRCILVCSHSALRFVLVAFSRSLALVRSFFLFLIAVSLFAYNFGMCVSYLTILVLCAFSVVVDFFFGVPRTLCHNIIFFVFIFICNFIERENDKE